MQESCGEHDEADFQNGAGFDERNRTEVLAPDEVQLAEQTTEDAACNTEKHEDEVMHSLVLSPVAGLEEDKLACAGGIELFQNDGSRQAAKECSP